MDFKSNNLKPALNWCSSIELASIDSTLCFVFLSETTTCVMNKAHSCCKAKNIAVIDEDKKVSTLRQLCGSSQLHIGSSKEVFVNITDSIFVPIMPECVFSCVDFKFSSPINSVCVFEDNILLFYESMRGPKMQCYNIYRPTKSSILLNFNGPPDNIISIQKGRKMFLLQMNGVLSSVNIADEKNTDHACYSALVGF